MDKIGFNLLQLIEENLSQGERYINPSFDSFSDLETTFHILIDNVYYEVEVEKNVDYIWFVFDYGKPDPIDDKLTNINTGMKKDNPREKDEAELLHQLFAFYDFNKNLLLLSSLKKAKMLEIMLQEKLQRPFSTKNFYKSKDDFITTLKEVNEISFTDAKNLFNQDNKRRKALIDLTGTDAPESFTLETKYSTSKREKIKNFIGTLINSKENFELSGLIIKGIDEENFDFIFNVDSFVQKIYISCRKNDMGKFDTDIVKQELINRFYSER